MSDLDSHIIRPQPCPECDGELIISFRVTSRTGERGEDGRVRVHVAFAEMEVIGGCEHAEQLREEVVFVAEGES